MRLFTLIMLLLSGSLINAQAPFIEWVKTFGGSSTDGGSAIVPLADGGYLAIGGSSSSDGDITDGEIFGNYWLIKLSSDGILEWEKSFSIGPTYDEPYDMIQTSDGSLIAVGTSFSDSGNLIDYSAVRFSADGDYLWSQVYGGHGSDIALVVRETPDNGLIIGGNGHDGWGYGWLVKINGSGQPVWYSYIHEALRDLEVTSDGYIIIGSSLMKLDNDGAIQ